MASRKHPLHLLLLAGLALGGLDARTARAAVEEGQRQVIIARGTGEVHARPDSVRVDVGVEAQSATLDEARTAVSGPMERVLAALKALNLPGLTLETRNIRFSPVYGSSRDNRPPSIIGYSGSNHVLVTAPNAPEAELASRAGRIVDAALGAGANNVGSIDFFLFDPSEAEDEALTLAVHNAESDAQTIARAAGVSLAGPTWIEEASAARSPRGLTLEAAMVSAPIEVGDLVIQSSVTAKFGLH